MSELKPCPFCGGAAHPFKTSGDERFGYVKTVKISCRTCTACVADQDTRDKNGWACKDDAALKATAKWNSRADLPPTLTAALELPEVKQLMKAMERAIEAIDAAYDGPDDNGAYSVLERAALAAIKEPKI